MYYKHLLEYDISMITVPHIQFNPGLVFNICLPSYDMLPDFINDKKLTMNGFGGINGTFGQGPANMWHKKLGVAHNSKGVEY